MSDFEVSREELLTREQVADRLATLAAALADGEKVEVALGTSKLKLHVPDQVRCEIEVEVDEDEIEFEVELKWSTTKPSATSGAAKPAPAKRVSAPATRRTRRSTRR